MVRQKIWLMHQPLATKVIQMYAQTFLYSFLDIFPAQSGNIAISSYFRLLVIALFHLDLTNSKPIALLHVKLQLLAKLKNQNTSTTN